MNATPGLGKAGEYGSGAEIPATSGQMICFANLIAAAPDLLEACEMALSCMAPEDNDVTARKLHAAIAKARTWKEGKNGEIVGMGRTIEIP